MNRTGDAARRGQSAGVEFKREDVHPVNLAKEVASLLNMDGGRRERRTAFPESAVRETIDSSYDFGNNRA